MLKESLYRNPFSDYNANTMNSEQITHYWENPFENYVVDITESEVASDTKPIVFTGGRGTGKTMILKHFDLSSEMVRAKNEGIDLRTYLLKNKYIGLYVRFDLPLLKGFDGLGLNGNEWEVIFAHFFEMSVAKTIVDALGRLIENSVIEDKEELFVEKLNEIVPVNGKEIKDFSKWFRKEINYVNTYRSSIVFEKTEFRPEKFITMGELSRAFTACIKEVYPILKDINFLILLDEYENFLIYQQRIVNSILKFADNVAFRVGMRPTGFHTFDTVSEDEFIKEKRDYRNILLENPLIKKEGDGTKYIQFLKGIAEKRLMSVPYFSERGMTDLSLFLGEREDPVNEAKQIIKGKSIHFDVYKEEIKKKYKEKKWKYTITDEQYNALRYPDNPLFEMQNLRMLLKPYKYEFVLKAFRDYIDGIKSEESKKYKNDYQNKYKLAYVFVLRSIYRVENKKYYGVTDFAYMSSGIAGMFIELCRCAFQYAYFSERDELLKGRISPEIQTRAAKDVGKTELDQIKRINKVGNQVYNFAINVGRSFIVDHIDKRIKYVETNQLSLNSSLLENGTFEKSVFDAAVMWSVIQKKKDLQQAGIGKDDEEIYILNRIFAPVFNISARTRGGKNLELDAEKFKRFIAKEEELDSITIEECDVDEEVEETYSQVNIFDIIVPTENDGE